MHDFSRIAYCPINIPRVSVDEELLETLVNSYDPGHHDGLWKCLPLLGRVTEQSDFRNAPAFESAWERRYAKEGNVLYNAAVYTRLEPLFLHIESLPIIPTHAQILCQTKDVGKHYDMKHQGMEYFDDYPGINDELEPAGYKILLNNFDAKSFYVASAFGKPNHYIKLPPDTNTFVINEKTFPHGAIKPPTPKYIVSIFGLINKEKHFELINRSIDLYKDYVVEF